MCYCNTLTQIELLETETEFEAFQTYVNELVSEKKLSRLYDYVKYKIDDDFNYDEEYYKCINCVQVWGLEFPTHYNSFDGSWRILEEGEPLGEVGYVNYINTSAKVTWGNRVEAQVILTVVNTGERALFLEKSPYDLEDENGKIIAISSADAFPQIIQPGESGYYFDRVHIKSWSNVAPFKVLPRLKVSATRLDSIRLDVSEFYLSNHDPHNKNVSVLGRVHNDSDKQHSEVVIAGIMFDKNEQPVGRTFSDIHEDIPVGTKIGFSGFVQSVMELSHDDISKYELFAFPRIRRRNGE